MKNQILITLIDPQYWEFLDNNLVVLKADALDLVINKYQIRFSNDFQKKLDNEACEEHLIKTIICKNLLGENQSTISEQLAKIMLNWLTVVQDKKLFINQNVNLFTNHANAIANNIREINEFKLGVLAKIQLWNEIGKSRTNLKRNWTIIENAIHDIYNDITKQVHEVIKNTLYKIVKTDWYQNFGKQKRIIANIDDYLKLYEKHISNENFWDLIYGYREWFNDNIEGIIHGWHNTFKDSTLLKNDYEFAPELANQLQQWINVKKVQLATKFDKIDIIDNFNLNQQTFLILMLSHYESSNEIIDMVELYQNLDEDIGYIEHNFCDCEYDDDGNISDFCSWCEDVCKEYNLIKEDTIWEQLKNRRDLLYEQLEKLYTQQSTSIKALLNEALNEIKVQKVSQETKTDRHGGQSKQGYKSKKRYFGF